MQEQARPQLKGEHKPSPLRRTVRGFLRGLGLAFAFVATVALAAGVAVVGPNIDQWRGVLPSLDGQGYESSGEASGRELLADMADDEAGLPPLQKKRGKGFSYLASIPSGASWPAHWCGTEVINYRVDLVGARMTGLSGARELQRWEAAFAAWSEASGGAYQFRYQGIGSFPLQITNTPDMAVIKPNKVREGEIAISYGTPTKLPYDGWKKYFHPGIGPALGVGGIGPVNWAPSASNYGLIEEATIIIDGQDVAALPQELPTVYIHEAGHALGLGHVKDDRQMMFHEAGPTATISAGDRRGIRKLANAGCLG